jgi:hypothetical protein
MKIRIIGVKKSSSFQEAVEVLGLAIREEFLGGSRHGNVAT